MKESKLKTDDIDHISDEDEALLSSDGESFISKPDFMVFEYCGMIIYFRRPKTDDVKMPIIDDVSSQS